MRAIFTEAIVDDNYFNKVAIKDTIHNHAKLVKVKLESTEILEISFFVYIF